ncbi:DJ-1/PfpI family protein [Leptospira idonii]|uniref:DJ-1/PfpI family protein n=1 Tax=Leptospira idonii TaxID=1193500 RepID=UPI0014382CE2|nr:DJ-1/PfpI family protein [Leptospira idonii]
MKLLYLLLLSVFIIDCAQLDEFQKTEEPPASISHRYSPNPTSKRKKAILIADEKGTEITDLLIPFYLLSATGQIDVQIASQTGKPVSVWKGIFLQPHLSLQDLSLKPDIIILPAVFHETDPLILNFIKSNTDKQFLSICEGAKIIGESKQFSKYQITTHASSRADLEKKYPDLDWKKDLKFTKDRNLISSAGVSSAVEATLILIEQTLGAEAKNKVLKKIKYPYPEIRKNHNSEAVGFWDSLKIASKLAFDGNPKIGVEIYEGMNEFVLAAYLDSFARTFPSRIETFGPPMIRSEYGLYLYPTQTTNDYSLVFCRDVCQSYSFPEEIRFRQRSDDYPFLVTLQEVESLYGKGMRGIVKKLLDEGP